MKYLFLLLLCVGCATPPDKPVCVQDENENAHCIFMMTGGAFDVDNLGKQYTQDGRNWNFTELRQMSLMMPPDTYAALKKFLLNYCHKNTNNCNYPQAVVAIAKIEEKMKASMNFEQRQLFEQILAE
jgi:hypothetical protein